MKKLTVPQLCFLGICVALNFVGGLIALALRLPIYLDSIGTIAGAFLYGPVCGMAVGAASGLLNGIVFDPVSFYFIPSAMVLGLMAGLLKKKGWLEKKKVLPLSVFAMTVPGSVVSSLTAAALFGGITSSGSSLLVQLLAKTGLPMTVSVFLVQIVTDYADRLISAGFALAILAAVPYAFRKRKLL